MASPTVPARTSPHWPVRWLLVAVWVTLPLTAAPGAARAIDGWSDAPELTAAVLLWIAWGGGLLALLAPRPIGLTALRAIAPAFAVSAVVGAVTADVDTLETVGALAATILAAVLTATPSVAIDAANGIAYGDESRYPLRTPPALLLTLVPLARALAVAGIAAPLLLLADEQVVAGVVALAVGVPLAVLAARSLHGLSTRWMVFVPAGFVVVDPFTLADPYLFVRAGVVDLRPADAGPAPADVVDLRLGATLGSLDVTFREPAELSLAKPGRRGGATIRSTARLRLAVVAPARLLAEGATRRFPIRTPGTPLPIAFDHGRDEHTGHEGQPDDQSAMPPPTNSSPS